jgi:hypothetical protein
MEPPAAPELTEQEQELGALDGAEYADRLRDMGIQTRFEGSLSESMKLYRRKLADDN